MKIVVISDIHGRNTWKKINPDEYDKIIFLGDYFDSLDIKIVEQLSNFNEIILFKEKYWDKIILLLGNHDIQYFEDIDENYSGFSALLKIQLENRMNKYLDTGYFEIVYLIDKILFSHAGITITWMKKVCKYASISEQNYKIKTLKNLFLFCQGENFSSSGDDITQGPMWIRPNSLLKNKLKYYTQVVGHTEHPSIFEKENVWFTDTGLKQYLVIEDNNFTIKDF